MSDQQPPTLKQIRYIALCITFPKLYYLYCVEDISIEVWRGIFNCMYEAIVFFLLEEYYPKYTPPTRWERLRSLITSTLF